jgi:hypothetical protein
MLWNMHHLGFSQEVVVWWCFVAASDQAHGRVLKKLQPLDVPGLAVWETNGHA